MLVRSVREIVSGLGGLNKVAKLCDVDYRSVSRWQCEDGIPSGYHPIVTRALSERGQYAEDRLFKWKKRGRLMVAEQAAE